MDLSAPFDTNTIFGWYLMWFFQFNISICYVSCIITITTYFVCCCIYIGALCEHFGFLYKRVTESVEKNRHETNTIQANKMEQEIKQQMSKVVIIHAKIYELVIHYLFIFLAALLSTFNK